LLEEAKTVTDILIVTDRLDGIRLQIEQLQGRLNLLDDLVDLAAIHVSLDPTLAPAALVEESNGETSPLEALADAWDGSLVVAEQVLVLLAYGAVALVWLGPIAIVVGIIAVVRGRSSAGTA